MAQATRLVVVDRPAVAVTTPDQNGGGQSFSTKEMLIRVEGKIDAILSRQQNYDVELALLKARADQLDMQANDRVHAEDRRREELRKELREVANEQKRVSRDTAKLGRKHAYQTGALATVVVIANIAAPLIARAFH